MKGNGITPITTDQNGATAQGYVVVDIESCNPGHHIFKEVHIHD